MKQAYLSIFSVSPSRSSTGQSVIEVTVAATAIVFVLVAVVSGLVLSTKNSSYANQQGLATKRAQEAMEIFRRFQVELGWESFYDELSGDGNTFQYCLDDLPDTVSSFSNLASGSCQASDYVAGSLFIREAEIDVRSATEIAVEIRVEWYEADDLQTARVAQVFRKWQ